MRKVADFTLDEQSLLSLVESIRRKGSPLCRWSGANPLTGALKDLPEEPLYNYLDVSRFLKGLE